MKFVKSIQVQSGNKNNQYKFPIQLIVPLIFIMNFYQKSFSEIEFGTRASVVEFLEGTWIETRLCGGMAGTCHSYEQDEFIPWMVFSKTSNSSDSISYSWQKTDKVNTNGISPVTYSQSIYGMRWKIMEFYYVFFVSNDTIRLGDNANDGYSHEFLRDYDAGIHIIQKIKQEASAPLCFSGNILQFDLGGHQTAQLCMYNLNGRIVKKIEAGSNSNSLLQLPGGFYSIRLRIGTNQFNHKIVVHNP